MLLDERGKSASMAILRAVVAGYLIYLGVSLIRGQLDGTSAMAPWLSWVSGVLFVLAGAGFGWYTWKRYRADMKEKPEEPQENTEGDPPDAEG